MNVRDENESRVTAPFCRHPLQHPAMTPSSSDQRYIKNVINVFCRTYLINTKGIIGLRDTGMSREDHGGPRSN